VRAVRDAQGPYNKDPAIAAMIARQTDLKVEAEDARPRGRSVTVCDGRDFYRRRQRTTDTSVIARSDSDEAIQSVDTLDCSADNPFTRSSRVPRRGTPRPLALRVAPKGPPQSGGAGRPRRAIGRVVRNDVRIYFLRRGNARTMRSSLTYSSLPGLLFSPETWVTGVRGHG